MLGYLVCPASASEEEISLVYLFSLAAFMSQFILKDRFLVVDHWLVDVYLASGSRKRV